VVTEATALPGDARCASVARRAVAGALEASGCDVDTDAVLLLTSELVTNALLHANPPLGLLVTHVIGVIRVEVVDGSPAVPVQRVNSSMATSGRGIELTDMLADRWGYAVDEEAGTKSVWFELDCGAR
jgi:anti-sigma regulatory factor (Ser/Thr protein kinase)